MPIGSDAKDLSPTFIVGHYTQLLQLHFLFNLV